MTATVEQRLKALGLTLPDAPAPVANYVPFHVAGNLLFISGQISRAADGTIATGKLGGGVDVAGGRAAAKLCALNILAQARAALGSLDRVSQVVKLTGFVNAVPAFAEHPQVVNGASAQLNQDVTACRSTKRRVVLAMLVRYSIRRQTSITCSYGPGAAVVSFGSVKL